MQPPTDQLTSARGVTDSRAAWPVVCISGLFSIKDMTKSDSWNMAMGLIKSKADLADIYDSDIIRHYLQQCGFALTGGISVEQDRTFKSLTDTATGDWWEVRSKEELINLLS